MAKQAKDVWRGFLIVGGGILAYKLLRDHWIEQGIEIERLTTKPDDGKQPDSAPAPVSQD